MGICTYGVEAALLLRLGRRWQLTAAGAFMQSIYIDNPRVSVISDIDNTAVDTNAESYMGDCRPGDIPQTAASVGAGYFGPKGWGFRLSAGYVGGRYVKPEPLRRTQRIARQAGTTPRKHSPHSSHRNGWKTPSRSMRRCSRVSGWAKMSV